MAARPLSRRELAAQRFRNRLVRRDAATLHELEVRWRNAQKRIDTELDTLLAKIAKARDAGEVPNVTWLKGEARLQALLDMVKREVDLYARQGGDVVTREQGAVVTLAGHDAEAMTKLALGTPPPGAAIDFTRLPGHAVRELIGQASDGGPLHRLIRRIAPDHVADVKRTLVDGVALGRNPKAIARDLAKLSDAPRYRLQRIARTEVLRSYREATRQTLQANAVTYRNGVLQSGVVRGWVWQADLSRCCGGCFAMHGTRHAPTEILNGHPNCRCTMVPDTASWSDLGFPAEFDSIDPFSADGMQQAAADAFGTLTRNQLQDRFGPGMAQAITGRKVRLPDMVVETPNRTWGASRGEASLHQALDNAAQRKRR